MGNKSHYQVVSKRKVYKHAIFNKNMTANIRLVESYTNNEKTKKEIEKLSYVFRTIDDPMIQFGLEGLTTLDDFEFSKGLYMVVGGFASQSYLPEKLRRPTADIDVLVGRPLNNEDFKLFIKPVIEFFRDNGYQTITKKHHQTFCIRLSKDKDKILIEFPRRNLKNFKNCEKRILRELENARMKSLSIKDGSYYRVSSPEDIILPKLVRLLNAHERGIKFKRGSPSELMNYLEDLREEAIYHLGNNEFAVSLKINADAYDILVLYSHAGINLNYFLQAAQDWNSLKKRDKEKEEIINYLLPGISI
ncbi:MAG: hypothetical protein QXK80_02650 [Candidatus Pacearchaeota archaeon]